MKTPFAWIFFLALILGASFLAGRRWDELRIKKAEALSDSDHCFHPAAQVLENRPFVFFICGFNNGAFVEKTLHSVFAQSYENYRLVYVDDASTDGSAEMASDAIYARGQMKRTTFLRNSERLGSLANLVRAVKSCQDREIIVVLNGEDWLAHEWVLSRLNHYYADSDLWLTYGQYREFPTYRLGSSRAIQQSERSDLRKISTGAFSHLKSFYVGLFKKIDEADLVMQGSFELAIMLPMLEMAEKHYQFIPETLYLSNRQGQKEERELQIRSEKVIRSLKPYIPLEALCLGEGL